MAAFALFAMMILACGPRGPLAPSVDQEQAVPHSLKNFSWVEEQRLAGVAKPGAYATLDDDLTALYALGIRRIVSLTEDPVAPDRLAAHGIEALHIPIEDFTAPSQAQMLNYAAYVARAVDQGAPLATHCHAGQGRTGTMLAAWLVSTGRTGQDAIDTIRALRPGSIETEAQEQAVLDFEATWAEQIP